MVGEKAQVEDFPPHFLGFQLLPRLAEEPVAGDLGFQAKLVVEVPIETR